MKRTEARVESNRLIADNAYKMVMHVERDIVDAAKPGQFIHIDVPGSDSRILRRPISINYMDGDRLAIVYAVVGDGTRRLTSVRAVSYTHLDVYKRQTPDREKPLKSIGAALFDFNKEIIDAVNDIVPSVKVQAAYYEQYGPAGMKAFKKTIDYAKMCIRDRL